MIEYHVLLDDPVNLVEKILADQTVKVVHGEEVVGVCLPLAVYEELRDAWILQGVRNGTLRLVTDSTATTEAHG